MRRFLIVSTGFALAFVFAPRVTPGDEPAALTARQVVARIQSHVGVPWATDTVDTFKAGDPDTPVTGIAVTMMATEDVLERAAAAGRNFVITHEPTFYGHTDETKDLEKAGDAVLAAKLAFITAHHLVVWRFHDHWHARIPDGIQTGVVKALGWERFQSATDQYAFVLPETTLDQLAEHLRARLGSHSMRVVGNPSMRLTRVEVLPGAPGFGLERRALERSDVEVLVVGETREWETVEYVADAMTQGRRKALILLGHIPAEQAGMDECARWLRGFVTEVPVEVVPAADPFVLSPTSRGPASDPALPPPR